MTSLSIFSSARKFSTRTRTTSRARVSSLISASFLATSRFTTASAILPAISFCLDMSPSEGYTQPSESVKRTGRKIGQIRP